MVKVDVRAYVAHTFGHRKYVKEVLIPKINALGILTKNPFYEPDGTTKRAEILLADKINVKGTNRRANHGFEREREQWIEMCRKERAKIVDRDLGYIDHTDFTIAYMTDISAGTTSEIFYTGVIKRRPVFLLSPNKSIRDHPWLIYGCRFGKVCATEEELLSILKRKYK